MENTYSYIFHLFTETPLFSNRKTEEKLNSLLVTLLSTTLAAHEQSFKSCANYCFSEQKPSFAFFGDKLQVLN